MVQSSVAKSPSSPPPAGAFPFKIGRKPVGHGRYVALQMTEVAIPPSSSEWRSAASKSWPIPRVTITTRPHLHHGRFSFQPAAVSRLN